MMQNLHLAHIGQFMLQSKFIYGKYQFQQVASMHPAWRLLMKKLIHLLQDMEQMDG